MIENESKSGDDSESDNQSFDDELRDWYNKHYPHHSIYPSPKNKSRRNNIIAVILIPVIIIGLYTALTCLISGGWILESFYFTFDSEAELNDSLLNETYYNLNADSRINVTNETYFLVLSIPELEYSIRFDYHFNFTSDNLINLKVEQNNVVQKITSFDSRDFYNPYNLSIEFQINSTDPEILNVTIFPPDNIINGFLQTYSVDSGILFIQLDEGEVIGRDMQHEILILPYNQTIIGIAEFDHRCPFR